jgi:hypothetical protein
MPKAKMMKTSDIATILFLFIVSLTLAYLVDKESANEFLSMLPNILGILLAGVLASLAIIFGLLSSNELAIIYKRTKEVKNRDIYSDFLRETKIDTIIIFSSLCLSVLILLISGIDVVFIYIPMWFLIGLGIFGLFVSILAVHDIIMSLFYLNQLRYELSTKREDEE